MRKRVISFALCLAMMMANLTMPVEAAALTDIEVGEEVQVDEVIDDQATGEVTNSFSIADGIISRGVVDESLIYYVEPVVEINGKQYVGKRVKLNTRMGILKVNQSEKSVTLKKYDRNDIAFIKIAPDYQDGREAFRSAKIANANSNFVLIKINKNTYAIRYKNPRGIATVKGENLKIQLFGDNKVNTDLKPNAQINVQVKIK